MQIRNVRILKMRVFCELFCAKYCWCYLKQKAIRLLNDDETNKFLWKFKRILYYIQARIYARAPRGPGPGRQIFRGGILNKSRLKYGMRKKKAVNEREI